MNLDGIAPALDLTLPPCLSNSAPEQVDYSFETIEYPGDSFTQLLRINSGGIIAGYYGVKANKGFINRLLSQDDFAQGAGHYNTEAEGSGPDHSYT